MIIIIIRSCSGNQEQMLLKSHCGIKRDSQYISSLSDKISTVPPIINMGDWVCIVRDLKTILVLVLLAFNFIPQGSHHSLTLLRARF